MVLYVLYVKAELEGIESVSISSTANLCFDIRNSAYESETREKIVVDPTSFVDHEEGAREPPHHFAVKWEGSKKPSVLTVLSAEELKTALKKKKGKHINKKYMIRTLTPDESDEFVPIAAFETRGIVPYAFHPMGGEFIVKSDGGHVFEGDEIDVSDDWCDYDDENDIALSISEFTSKFEAV